MLRLEILRWWNERFGPASIDWLLATLGLPFLLGCFCLVAMLIVGYRKHHRRKRP